MQRPLGQAKTEVMFTERMPDGVLLVVTDAEEGGGFGDDGWRRVGCCVHGTATVAISLFPEECR